MPEVIFKWKRGTAAEWLAWDFVLKAGEPGVETDTGYFKLGNGFTPWVDLPYFLDASGMQAFIDDYLEEVGTGVDARIGNMDNLNTDDKSTVVAAINEVNAILVPLTSLYNNAKAG